MLLRSASVRPSGRERHADAVALGAGGLHLDGEDAGTDVAARSHPFDAVGGGNRFDPHRLPDARRLVHLLEYGVWKQARGYFEGRGGFADCAKSGGEYVLAVEMYRLRKDKRNTRTRNEGEDKD